MQHLIGDLRQELGRDLQANIANIIDAKKHLKSFYILVRSQLSAHNKQVVETRLMVLSRKPPAMIGTICLHVDNGKGQVRKLWCLPADIPTWVEQEEKPLAEIGQAAERLGKIAILNQ